MMFGEYERIISDASSSFKENYFVNMKPDFY